MDLVLDATYYPATPLIAGDPVTLGIQVTSLEGTTAFSLTLTITWSDDLALSGTGCSCVYMSALGWLCLFIICVVALSIYYIFLYIWVDVLYSTLRFYGRQ